MKKEFPTVLRYRFYIDDSTFKNILQFICDEELLHVKAIVWNILPNVRKDALLTKQARLIDLFKPGDIWHNVIIVCKQSRNPEDDAQVVMKRTHSLLRTGPVHSGPGPKELLSSAYLVKVKNLDFSADRLIRRYFPFKGLFRHSPLSMRIHTHHWSIRNCISTIPDTTMIAKVIMSSPSILVDFFEDNSWSR